MKFISTAVLALLMVFMGNAQTVDVTFQVDMSEQTVDPAGVHIAGAFQGWQPDGTPLTDQGGGIWAVTLTVNENTNYEYKFINGNAWGQDESNLSGCDQNGNRFINTGTSNETLDPVCFDSCSICSPPTVDITFQVDMSEETVDAAGVHLVGSFQGWQADGTPMTDLGNGIWSITLPLAQGGSFEYKFINGNAFGQDESVPSECAVMVNREVVVADADQVIPVVCFGECDICSPPGGCTDVDATNYDPTAMMDNGSCTYVVTFQVDMSQYAGVFTAPEVIGTMNGFTYGSLVLSDDDFDNVFTGTAELTNGQYEFLFAVDGGVAQESFNGSESCTVNTVGFWNRVLVVNGDTTYPVYCYNTCAVCVPSFPDVRLASVDVDNQEVTLINLGTATQDVSSYWFCNFPAYDQLSGLSILNGSATLDPGATVTYSWADAAGATGECGLYTTNQFNNSGAIIDYMQWETGGNQRASVAVAAGVWDGAANFVSGDSPYVFNGVAGEYGSTFWSGTVAAVAYDVTFQVDMSLETVSPEGVSIAGNFNDPLGDGSIINAAYPQWLPGGIVLTDADMDGIYEVTLTLIEGATYEYKYINGDEWGEDESVPGACATNNNRSVSVSGADVVIPVHCYASCDPCVFNDYDVTFRVDMSEETVDANGVHLAGSFNGFDPLMTPMTDQGNGIWSATVNVTAGDNVSYRFVNGDDISGSEIVPAQCGTDDGNGTLNRMFVAPASDLTLDIVCFGACEGCASSTVDITFQVDMSLETVSVDGVYLVGSFQTPDPWTAGLLAMTDQGNGVWSYTATVPAGSSFDYKYLNGATFAEEESVPQACGVDNGFGGFNRTFTAGFADETIDLHCFSSCVDCNIPPVNITFQVDMSDETVSMDGVHIAGDFQGWDPAGSPMVDQGNGIWTFTAQIIPNSVVNYKFINGNTFGNDEFIPNECNVSNNRQYTIGDMDETLPLVCFGKCTVCSVPQVNVTFQVDMSNEVVAAEGVFLAGTFQGWDPAATPMTNAGGGIWTVTVPVDENGTYEYKFLNGNTFDGAEDVPAECAVNTNRQVIVAQSDVVIPVLCYGTCAACLDPQVTVTFRVDMSNTTVSPDGVHLVGNFQGWDATASPMTFLGYGIYEYSVILSANTTYYYKYVNGDEFGEDELVPAPCAVENGFGSNNRELITGTTNILLDVVCYEQCELCTGCTDPFSLEFSPFVLVDDGSCATPLVYGCTYPDADNYSAIASVDDGSCEYSNIGNGCPADFNDDDVVNAGDLLFFLSQFGVPCP